ncbi:MAG: sel1 repeat family protein [Proteobacteria bacterium]|nr:sel1 repeat family protein [Pseudomonadota bacterium]
MKVCVVAAAVVAALGLASAGTVASAQSDWLKQLEADCNKGDAQACSNLGSQLYMVSNPRQPEKARAAYEKGCALKQNLASTVACANLYMMLELGEGGPRDPARAQALKPKACNTGLISLDVYLKSKGVCRK